MSDAARVEEPPGRMTREEFYRWVEGRPGKYERVDGKVFAMAPERVRHSLIKAEAYSALREAVQERGLPCTVFVDGPTIQVEQSDYEPDVIVRCGSVEIAVDGFAIPDPVILVEILSPTTRRVDLSQKLADYFRLPTVQHYLILFADRVQAIHHRRADAQIETRIVTEGEIVLNPPGITVPLSKFYPGAAVSQ